MEVFIGIDVDRVESVLLADGWHQVKEHTFKVGNYGFLKGQVVAVNAIAVKGTVSHWTQWTESDGGVLAAPLTSLLAVKGVALTTEAAATAARGADHDRLQANQDPGDRGNRGAAAVRS
jgi:hypothetical protein